jgi:hypothetical protein
VTFLVLDRKCDAGNMSQDVKDFDCQNGLKQKISEKKDSDEDLYFDEELNSYLNQLEAIPIELFEENCGDSSDGSKRRKNAFTERTQAASRNTYACPSTAEDAVSAASISSFIEKSVSNVLQKKGQEESKMSVGTINEQMGSDSEKDLSIAVCGQMISRSRQKTVRADTVINTYGNCREQSPEEESFSSFENSNRVTSSENSPARTVISTSVKRVSKLETDSQRTKKRRKRKEREYSENCLSDSGTKNSVNAEKIMEESVSSTREKGGMKKDIISCMEAVCRLETESPVSHKKYCDDSNDEDDKNLYSIDIIKTENNLRRYRRDSSSSLSSSFSGRETVILPLEDHRLPHLKEELRCTTPNKWKTCVLEDSSSSESLFQSADDVCVISEDEPSPFPISKAISDIASCQIVSDVIETKNDLALPKADCFKTTSDCAKIFSETCESDPILTKERKKYGLLEKIQSKSSDLQRQSPSPSLSPTTESQLTSDSCNGACKVLQPKAIARKRGPRTPSPCSPPRVTASDLSTLGHKSLTPSPPRYSGSASVHGMFPKSNISPILVSTEQLTDKLRTPTGSSSDCSSKAEVESSKPKDKLHGSVLVQGTKLFTPKDSKSTSISPEESSVSCKSMSPVSSCRSYSPARKRSGSRTVDRKSMSSVSSCSSYSPVRKRSISRTQRRSWKSQSRSPCKYRRRSRSVSPWRRKWKKQRSSSRSISPQKWRWRSRSPWRGRARSRSRVVTRYCRSRGRKSRSRRGSRSPRRYSRSPRRYLRSPRRYSRSPRRYSRSPRRYSRSPRRYSRSPRRVSRKRRRRSSSLSISPPSAAEKRMKLKEKTETALCSIVAALNGTQSAATAVSVARRQNASAASTVSSVPSGALPTVQLTQVH